MKVEGTVTEHHGTPLSARAVTRESHFVLLFQFHWRRPSHFHDFKLSASLLLLDPTIETENIETTETDLELKMCPWKIMCVFCFSASWIFLLQTQSGLASGKSNEWLCCFFLFFQEKKQSSSLHFFCLLCVRIIWRQCRLPDRVWSLPRRNILLPPALFRVSLWPLVSH